jgi:hypothetical protein
MTCRECRCTEDNACLTTDGTCHWAEPRLCSACANPETKIRGPVEIAVSD